MGIFDDIEDLGSGILKTAKKKGPGIIAGALPVIGPAKTAVDLLGWDNTIKYVLPTLMGAGMGAAAAGGPTAGFGAIPGAIVGGTAALAATIAGPKAGHLVEEKTGSDLAGTAAEFGVYGLSGGLGLGGVGAAGSARVAEKVGMEKVLAHLALKSSLEMGVLSGTGAAAGQGAARAAGIPEEFGTLGGAVGGPMLAPAAFGAARGAMYRTDNAALKNLAEYFGANEANSLRANRTIDMRRSDVTSEAHKGMVNAIDRNIAQEDMVLLRTAPEQTPEYYRASTGGFAREELQARELGRDIPVVKEITTPEYINAKNRLKARQAGITAREQELADTMAKYGPEAAAIPAGGTLEQRATGAMREVWDIPPVPEGQVRLYSAEPAKGSSYAEAPPKGAKELHYVDVAQGTADKYKGKGGYALPDGVTKRAVPVAKRTDNPMSWVHVGEDGTERLIPDTAAIARLNIEGAQARHGEAYDRMGKLLGVERDAIPADVAEQQRLLRDKYMPDYETKLTEAQKALQDMDPATARDIRLKADAAAETFNAGRLAARVRGAQRKAEFEAFRQFVVDNPEIGAVPDGLVSDAVRAHAAVQQQLALAENYGTHGYTAARERMEPFEKYLSYANFSSKRFADPKDAAQVMKEFLTNPRGEINLAEAAGGVKPVRIAVDDKGVPLVRGNRIKVRAPNEPDSAAQWVRMDDLKVRYDETMLNQRNTDLESIKKDLLKANRKDRTTLDQLNEQYKGLHPVELAQSEKISAEQMASDLGTARTDLMSKFMPTGTSIEGRYFTPEDELQQIRGAQNLLVRGFKMNASRATIDRDVQSMEYLSRSFQDRLGDVLSVDDVGILDAYNASPQDSPIKAIYRLLGKSPNDYMKLVDDTGNINLGGAAGQFFRHHAIGEAVSNPALRGILADHYGALEANATTAAAFYMPLHNMLDEVGAELLGIPRGAAPQFKNAFGKLTSEGLHPGRALKAAASELHPLSKEGSWAKYLEGVADWSKASKDVTRGLDEMKEKFPEQVDLVKTLLLHDKRFFMDNPEMFGDLVNEPRINNAMKAMRFLDTELRESGNILGLAPETEQRIMAMQVDPSLRSYLDKDVLRQGTGREKIKNIFAGKATKVDLALEVLQAMKTEGISKPLSEMMVWGREADMARPIGTMQSLTLKETMGKVAKIANRQVTPDDLVFKGGAWSINSKNKWPAEIAKELGGFNDIISGNHKWAGLQKVSQQIAYGNLAADLSLMGIQGYKYLAHSLLAGNLEAIPNFLGRVKVPGALAAEREAGAIGATGNVVKKQMNTVSSHIMSDYGFYSWLRGNLDEVQYYNSLGLTGGLKGYIAGPDVRKLPLETLPIIGKSWVGKAMGGIRMGTDLQFNRQLFYWKVQGVRENLEVAKSLRAVGRDFAEHYYRNANDNFKQTVDELGGLDGYLLGEKEDVVKSVVRQVNRSMGGVSMDAEGIGVNRQALEQIMMIVPGFFRAQVGQWASIITKPHTLEGHMAMSMLSREYLFAAGVATGLSRLMGTNDEMNYTDMTKPTWLGVPLPDGGSLNLLPTMALPRLASRVTQNAVKAAQGEQGLDPSIALESFARGRLSPMVSAVYDNMNNEDFLGRKYDSAAEKWGMTLANTTLPIIMSSMTEDIKESMKQNGVGTGQNWMDIAESTGANLIGKSVVPQHPRDRLDKAAQGRFGTDWGLLTDAEKKTMREDPAITAMEAEYNFYSQRRAGSAEQRIDSAYQGYADEVKKIWEQPRMIGNFASTQQDDDQLIAAGKMPGDVWRDRYHRRQQDAALTFEHLDGELRRAGVDPDQIRKDKMQRLKDGRDPGSIAFLVQSAKTEYAGVDPATKTAKLSTPSGEVSVEVTDWDKFQADREDVLSRYPSVVAARVRQEDSSQTPGVATYRQAAEQQRAIENMPRYRGLSVEQGSRLDSMQAVMSKLAESAKGQMGLPAGTVVPGLASGLRNAAVAEMQKQGIVRNAEDMQLAALAISMAENPKLANQMRNPQQVLAILQSPLATIYYPYLRSRVPKELWPKLPAQVFNAPLVQAELQASEG